MLEQRQLFSKQGKLSQNKAQFITEILLALLVFLIVFVSFYSLLTSYIRNTKLETDRIIANFLAQEGLELVRALRNYRYVINACRETINETGDPFCNEYNTSTWLGDIGDNSVSSTIICLDYSYTTTSCNNLDSLSSNLYLNNNGFFSIDPTGSSTKFKRIVEISNPDGTPIENATSLKVVSKVKWNDNQIELRGIIYNIESFETR